MRRVPLRALRALVCLLLVAGCTPSMHRGLAPAERTEHFPLAWKGGPAPQQPETVVARAPAEPPPAPAPAPVPARRPESLMPPPEAGMGGLMAVLPLDTSNAGLDAATRLALEEAVRTVAGEALVNYGYTVLTGDTTLALLADNGIDAERACEASCALDAARELQAQVFISGTVARTEGEYVAFIRLFESGSGRQLSSLSLEGETVRELRQTFARRADEFFGRALRRLR